MLDWFRDLAMSTIVDTRLSYADLQATPNDGKRYEIIEGEVHVTPAPSWRHQEIVRNLVVALHEFVVKAKLGKVAVAPLDVVLDERTALQPDVLFIRADRLAIVQSGHVEGAPDLVIEVLSPGTAAFDRKNKLQAFARAGVSEVWYVDPEAQAVEVLNLSADKRYVLSGKFSGEASVISAVLPGLPLTLRQVFAS
jgi:Uma2 family endonuclease